MLSSCCLSLVCVCRFVWVFVAIGNGDGLPSLVSFNFLVFPLYLDVLFFISRFCLSSFSCYLFSHLSFLFLISLLWLSLSSKQWIINCWWWWSMVHFFFSFNYFKIWSFLPSWWWRLAPCFFLDPKYCWQWWSTPSFCFSTLSELRELNFLTVF